MKSTSEPAQIPRTPQSLLAAVMLLAVGATAVVVAGASHSRLLERVVCRREYERFKAGREHYMNRGLFLDFEDRLLVEQLPAGAAREGGVYFLGPSTMKWATAVEETPAEDRSLVHNFSIGATNHAMQFEFVRYLVERENMLARGADRTHVVLGLYWSMSAGGDPERFWAPLWRRYGLYDYDRQHGIRAVDLPPLLRRFTLERARMSSFLLGAGNRVMREIVLALGIPLTETEHIRDPHDIRRWMNRDAGRSPAAAGLDRQIDQLDQMAHYLRERGVDFALVLLPHRAPLLDMPLPAAYLQSVRRYCRQHAVPLYDLSDLLSEDEYWDINHSNYQGLVKTNRRLLEIARRRLGR